MTRLTLKILTGNVGCGKSLWAYMESLRTGAVVVNMDSIQAMCAGGEYGRYDKAKKDVYWDIENAAIESALRNRQSVIVDRTNMDRKRRSRFIEIGKKCGAVIVSVCWGPGSIAGLDRRLKRPRGVPESTWERVFEAMMKSYEPPSPEEGFHECIEPPLNYRCHAFDFDGTIVKNKFPEIGDPIEKTINKMRELATFDDNLILIWTCRSGDHEDRAREYLRANDIPFHFINENPIFEMGGRKMFAHRYYDDRNVLI